MTAKNEILIKKFFKWEFKEFTPHLISDEERDRYPGLSAIFNFPVLKTYDQYNNIEREAVLRLITDTRMCEVTIKPPVNDMRCYFVYENGSEQEMKATPLTSDNCTLCVDVVLPLTAFSTPIIPLGERLRLMFADDPSTKFLIICQSETIEGIKPILAASSPVFKAMFDSGMKEANQNSMEITDFDPIVVKKMVEFCETDQLAAFEGLEMELLQIAHKYQIQALVNYATKEIVRTTTKENRCERWYIAHQHAWEDLKEWFSKF